MYSEPTYDNEFEYIDGDNYPSDYHEAPCTTCNTTLEDGCPMCGDTGIIVVDTSELGG